MGFGDEEEKTGKGYTVESVEKLETATARRQHVWVFVNVTLKP